MYISTFSPLARASHHAVTKVFGVARRDNTGKKFSLLPRGQMFALEAGGARKHRKMSRATFISDGNAGAVKSIKPDTVIF